jgi:hypothetical protein
LDHSRTFNLSTHEDDTSYYDGYFRRINGDYYFFLLGKAGEPIANADIDRIELTPLVADKLVFMEEFATDKEGKIKLGPLKEIISINISGSKNEKSFNSNWHLPIENEKFFYPLSLHCLEGEDISLPYPHDMFNSGCISLMKTDSIDNPISNLFDSIVYQRKEGHEIGDVIFRDLEPGKFLTIFRFILSRF